MILVDGAKGSIELLPLIKRIGVHAEKANLSFGDFSFQGNGPKGDMYIGIERKTLHDLLHCIDDNRYSAHQIPGMNKLYDRSFLILEGCWKPHDPDGFLMEGFNGGSKWAVCRYRSQQTMYHKLYRYLLSVSLSGVIVIYSRDIFQTAFNICETFHYFQKKWSAHTSLLDLQKFNIPTLNGKPSLVRMWANDITDVGTIISEQAEMLFKTPIRLAQSSEQDWMRIDRVGPATARKIMKEIWGHKD